MLKKPGFPAARTDFVWDFHGDGMGRAKQEDGRGEWENLFGKTLSFGVFSLKFTLFRCPRRREKGGWAGDGLGTLNIKKEPRNEFLSPFCGVLFE